MKKSYLIIGPGACVKTERVGGVTIPFSEYVSWLFRNNCNINSSAAIYLTGKNILFIIFSYVRAFFRIVFAGSNVIIQLHLTWNAVLFFSPAIYIANFFGKKIYIRKFAGNFDEKYDSANFVIRFFAKLACTNSCVIFFETKYLVKWGESKGFSVDWWPNSRNIPANCVESNLCDSVRNGMVFIGRVSVEKGIDKIRNVCVASDYSVQIVIYGPVDSEKELDRLIKDCGQCVRYGGILNREKVFDVLTKASILILPTGHLAEGYPGVIIESAYCGVPVISSIMRGPSELISEMGFGVCIDFDDLIGLRRCINELNLCKTIDRVKLYQSALKYDSEIIFNNVTKLMV